MANAKDLVYLDLSSDGVGADYRHNQNDGIVDGPKKLAMAIARNSTLTSLHLDHNNLCDSGAHMLSWALTKNTTLHTLSVAENNISDAGCESFAGALATVIKGSRPPALTCLHLGNNRITPNSSNL